MTDILAPLNTWKIKLNEKNFFIIDLQKREGDLESPSKFLKTIIVYCTFLFPLYAVASPVDLIFFRIETNQYNKNQLVWATASETNNKMFTIEKSTDGKEYLPIGTVDAFGESREKINYMYCDPTHWIGMNYYRLKIETKDGQRRYSQAQKIRTTKPKQMTLYPFGKREVFNLHPGFSIPSGTTLEVLDMAGQHIISQPLKTGSVSINVNIASLPPGTYIVNLHANELRLSSQKLIKG